MIRRIFFLLFLLSCSIQLLGQLQATAKRTGEAIKIDAKLDELGWQQANSVGDFMQLEPSPYTPSLQKAEVKILYDDKAIYIGAHLYDSSPDSIMKQMTERDNIGITDWFAVVIDAYQDGQNGVGFVVTPAGIQMDLKYSAVDGSGGAISGDENWDAVWDSQARIVEDGWMIEMSIPFSAIRFPNKDVQLWNINFARMIRRYRETSYWNEVRPDIDGFLNQSGRLAGIENVKAPLRLSATPFLVTYGEWYHDKDATQANSWARSISGGMDVKYGINDAFTLDMTLIPDFGQARSDNQVLNLSPFEVRFDENRQFFTEGTELFNKGGLFYSRRVGGRPIRNSEVYDQLSDFEEVTDNPQEAQLYNATKVSGRTNGGLGIGLFNATSQRTLAKIENTETGSTRSFETNPLTNYNVLVFDQNLKNNSSVTLINTNVMRDGVTYDANSTGALFSLRNKANSYAMSGGYKLSQKYFSGKELTSGVDSIGLGNAYSFSVGRTSGKFQYGLEYDVESRDYDPNDLGFLFSPNERYVGLSGSYNIFKPFGNFNRMRLRGSIDYSRLVKPNVFTNAGFELNFFAVTKNFFGFGAWTYIEPVATYDYFEPRSNFERYYTFPTSSNFGGFVSSDYRKVFAYDIRSNFRKFNADGRYDFNVSFSPRVRISDRLSFILNSSFSLQNNNEGYVDKEDDGAIIFGVRDLNTIENILNAKYIFTNNMSLTFRLRHYWSVAEYSSFGQLTEDGKLAPTDYHNFRDNSFNAFNIDMVYRWRFAPGSDLFVVWKNQISEFSNDAQILQYGYDSSLGRLPAIPQSNSFSVKLIYYLDYLSLRRQRD